ncbi:inositol monophosphatase family protein [Salana multivorans]
MAEELDADALARLVAAASAAATAAAQGLTGTGEVQRKSGHNDVVTEDDAAAERVILEVLSAQTPEARVLGEEGTAWDGVGGGGENDDGGDDDGGEVTWHVDPIDGTSNYASGAPLYCVSIGAAVRGRAVAGVVLDPVREELFATGPGGVTVNGRPVAARSVTDPRDAVLLTNAPYEGAWFVPAELAAYGAVLQAFRGVRRLGSSALALAWVAAGRMSVACELRTNVWDHAAGAALVLSGGGRFIAWDRAGHRTENLQEVAAYIATAPGFTAEVPELTAFVASSWSGSAPGPDLAENEGST